MKLTDEDLLNAVFGERRQSAGFEEDNILLRERELALNYAKGQMPDLPSLNNRSQAVSTDVADAIETALPDILEIFTGGDDVVSFIPNNKDDEQQAEQETDYLRFVLFEENPGFLALYSGFKDALTVKVGVWKFWWEKPEPKSEKFSNKSYEEMQVAAMEGELADVTQGTDPESGHASYSFTLLDKPRGMARIMAVPPEDFTVARDTVRLSDTTYCAFRSRPRAQALKDQGIDPDIVDELPPYGVTYDETLRLARDTAGEHADQRVVTGNHDLRQVEVIEHYIRIDADGSGAKIWRVLTGGGESILIEKEPVESIPFAAVTPFIVPHRFYGESVADKLIEMQRQRTALKRIMLDSGYFAMNQRTEVAMDRANEWTIMDLLRNEPAMPVRVKTQGAVTPLSAGRLDFDVMAALEYSAVEAEQRTGIVRNAQGLNPETLHDTASGAMASMAAAQKRLRLIARNFAETGVRDLYLGVHQLLRENADQATVAKLRGKWVPIDPSQWGERTQMAIQVGLGSGGRHEELATLTNLLGVQEGIVKTLGPLATKLLTPTNIYNLVTKLAEKGGEKNPAAFFTDPATVPDQPPQPNPDMIKAQQDQAQHQDKMQLQQQDQQTNAQLAAAKLATDSQIEQQKAHQQAMQVQADAAERMARLSMERDQMERDDQFRYAQLSATSQLEHDKLAQAAQLEREKLAASMQQAMTIEAMKDQIAREQMASAESIQASEAADAKVLDD